ncbi:MAG: APC family permease [Gemmatimonadota bacterium]
MADLEAPTPGRAPGQGGDGTGLRREVGLPGAVFMGLGSILGTGLFVSLGIAAGVAGSGILLALPLAALLALFNGLSSAQLAAAHPMSGGTYEYGHRFLSPALGFSAGSLFLLAKSASAATAALGVGGYLILLLQAPGGASPPSAASLPSSGALLPGLLAAGTVVLLTLLAAVGIRRSNQANVVVVGMTLTALLVFLAVGLPHTVGGLLAGAVWEPSAQTPGAAGLDGTGWRRLLEDGPAALLHATALLFVAYTGYGRIATLGEEVRDPRRVIPRAIWITLGVVALLYTGTAMVALGTLGAEGFAGLTEATAAPLHAAAAALEVPGLALLVGIAAVTAMVGVLLNLILGLSRVALAMGRRGDLPRFLAAVHAPSGSPRFAVVGVGMVILLLVSVGDVRTTWSFSAFTVLAYYGITNLAALHLPPELRLYPRWVPVMGLAGCALLAFQVEPAFWITGASLLAGALAVRHLVRGW